MATFRDLLPSGAFWTPSVRSNPTPEESLRAEEAVGFRIAGLGRLIVSIGFALYIPFGYPAKSVAPLFAVAAAFGLVSLLQIAWADRANFLKWGKYLLIALDVTFIVFLIVVRNPFDETLWTTVQAFRLQNQLILIAYIGAIALTNAPSVVLFGGVVAALEWAAVSTFVGFSDGTLTWSDLSGAGGQAAALDLYLNPAFFDSSVRFLETLVILLLSGLLALAAWRGRRLLKRFVDTEADKTMIRETFGRYVPDHVAGELMVNGGILKPDRRPASILYCDLEGFTEICGRISPDAILDLLNDYFDAVGEVVREHGGTITQFQGDAFLATFNLPIDDPDYAENAVKTALAILSLCETRTFKDISLRVRVGVATGPVVAGSCGGRARMTYTVHGDTVNLAARLEGTNRTYGTRILICDATADVISGAITVRFVAETDLRGFNERRRIYEPVRSA